jgi:hypothetical protein
MPAPRSRTLPLKRITARRSPHPPSLAPHPATRKCQVGLQTARLARRRQRSMSSDIGEATTRLLNRPTTLKTEAESVGP